MSRFVTVVSQDLVEYCQAAMFHDNMDLGKLMVHAHKVDKSRRKKRVHEGKKPKTMDLISCSSGRVSYEV